MLESICDDKYVYKTIKLKVLFFRSSPNKINNLLKNKHFQYYFQKIQLLIFLLLSTSLFFNVWIHDLKYISVGDFEYIEYRGLIFH